MTMTKPKLILFNGPRHSGKDTAALYCEAELGAYHFKMSGPIKAALRAMFSLSQDDVDYLESIKTSSTDILFGESYVSSQISFSECWAKQRYGIHVFGLLAARHLTKAIQDNPDQKLYVCSDSGFDHEAKPLLKIFGKNTLLVTIYRDGKTFEGDSRSYIDLPGVTRVSVTNNGSVSEYQATIRELVLGWVSEELRL